MSIEQLLRDLAHADQPIRSTRLTALSNLSADEVDRFGKAWATFDGKHRRRLLRHLAELAEDNPELSFDAVFRHGLGDPDPAVRERALDGLCECEDRSLILPLIDLLRDDPAEAVRASAATALGRFALMTELGKLRPRDGARVEAALLAVIRNRAEPVAVRRRAIEAIGARSLPEVRSIIDDAYASDDPLLRASALFAMGRSCDRRWLPTLYQELESPDAPLRFEAVNACGEMGEEEAVPHLLPLLADADSQVQLAAVAALGHIGGNLARQTLQHCLRHSDARVRDAAEDAIEELQVDSDPLGFF